MKSKVNFLDIPKIIRKLKEGASENDFVITDNIYPGVTFDPVRPDFYGIAYCYGGNYKVKISFKEYDLKPGHLMFFKPMELNELIEINNYKGILIAFNLHFLISRELIGFNLLAQPFFEEGAGSLLKLKEENKENVRFYFETLLRKENDIFNPYRKHIMRGILISLLYEITALYPKSKPIGNHISSRKKNIAKDFQKLLNTHYKKEHHVSFYAEKLNITPGYLSEILKEKTGKSTLEIIQNKLILEAKVLLKNSDLNIGEISRYLNFSAMGSFIRFFKKNTQMAPSKYRTSFN